MTVKRSKFLTAGALILLVIAAVAGYAWYERSVYSSSVSNEAAIVNGTYISKAAFEKQATRGLYFYEKSARKLTPSEKAAFRSGILDQMINKELILQEAKKRNIAITDTEVNNYVTQRKKAMGDAIFKKMMADRGFANEAQYKEKIKYDKTYRALMQDVTKGDASGDQVLEFSKFLNSLRKQAAVKVFIAFK